MRIAIVALLCGIMLAQGALAQDAEPSGTTGEAPPTSSAAPERLTNVIWLERPSAADFARSLPARATQARSMEARVILSCLVAEEGRLACDVVSEEPGEMGFGAAALEVAMKFRIAPLTRDDVPTEGGRVRLPISWRLGG